jgi:hypothetical protein
MYVVETLGLLDPASPTYALDVLTLVESILEQPHVVLRAQLDKLKGETVARLKAEGVEYEARMEELEKLEHPKPLGDFIYDSFNAFARKHPWVGQENIRPKSVARDMVERFCSFHDYVRDYGLERSEGVLLRYVSQAYKALVQTVPERFRSDEVADVADHLRTMLRSVDSSLLDEWESLRETPAGRTLAPVLQAPPRALDADPRALGVRVRGEMHRLLVALARKRWDEARAAIVPEEWTAARLETALQPYFAEHASMDVSPSARRPQETVLKPGPEPRTFEVWHRIHDPAGDDDWAIHGWVDLRGEVSDRPVLRLRGVAR